MAAAAAGEKKLCVGRICGPAMPTEVIEGVAMPRVYAAQQCGKACAEDSNLCKTCLGRESRYLANTAGVLPLTWHGRMNRNNIPSRSHIEGSNWYAEKRASLMARADKATEKETEKAEKAAKALEKAAAAQKAAEEKAAKDLAAAEEKARKATAKAEEAAAKERAKTELAAAKAAKEQALASEKAARAAALEDKRRETATKKAAAALELARRKAEREAAAATRKLTQEAKKTASATRKATAVAVAAVVGGGSAAATPSQFCQMATGYCAMSAADRKSKAGADARGALITALMNEQRGANVGMSFRMPRRSSSGARRATARRSSSSKSASSRRSSSGTRRAARRSSSTTNPPSRRASPGSIYNAISAAAPAGLGGAKKSSSPSIAGPTENLNAQLAALLEQVGNTNAT